MNRSAFVSLILAGAAVPALALAGPFDGTWKLDTARSKFTGDTITYNKTDTGYHYSNGSTVSYNFAVDGKDYPTIPGRTVAWTKAPDGSFDVVAKANGKVVSKAHRTVSRIGRTMTTTYTEYRPDGTTVHETDTYTRVTGGTGLPGEWRDTKVQASSETMKIATSAGGHFEIGFPAFKETISGRADGSPATVKGPTIPPGASAAYKADGPQKWSYTISLGGKVFGLGVMSVSADGKTLTRKSWLPGKESEAAMQVYSKM